MEISHEWRYHGTKIVVGIKGIKGVKGRKCRKYGKCGTWIVDGHHIHGRNVRLRCCDGKDFPQFE